MVSVCINNKEIALASASLIVEVWCVNACATGLIKAAFTTAVAAVKDEVFIESIAIGICSSLVFVCINNKEIALALAGLLVKVWCVNACATGLFKAAFTTAVAAVEDEVFV